MICSECNEKNTRVVHCLCRLCTQKIINNANELGKKQGALEELTLIRNQLDVLPNRHFKKYLRSVLIKRIKELKEKGRC
jgi:hypothetical protein